MGKKSGSGNLRSGDMGTIDMIYSFIKFTAFALFYATIKVG